LKGTGDWERHPFILGSGRHHDPAFAALLLVAFASVMCLGGLGAGPPLSDHEAINAQAARQTIQSGEWLIPRLGEIPWIRKTPLGIWATAAVSLVVDDPSEAPVSELSARLPSAIAAFVNALLAWWLASMTYGRRAGLVGGFICAGCVATVFYSHDAQVDMLLAMLTTLSFACFYRGAVHPQPRKGFMVAFYFALSLAMMAKAPLPLATVGLALVVYWFVTAPLLRLTSPSAVEGGGSLARRLSGGFVRQFKDLGRLWLIPGVLAFVVLAGAWPLYVYCKIDNAANLWLIEYLDRYTGDMSDESRPFLYYVPIVFGLTAPFLLSLPEAVAAPFLRRYRPQREGLTYAFTWMVVGLLFLSSASFKRPHYVLSIVPACCLLLTPVIDRLFFGMVSVASKVVQGVCRALPVLLAISLVLGGVLLNLKYPSLLRAYTLVACGALAVWTAAAWSYARGRRTMSFALLNLAMMIVPLFVWPILGKHISPNPEGQALALALRENGVASDAPIYWVGGRPDASIEFYSHYRIRRLIDEIEMTEIRENRRSLSAELYREFARRIEQQLAQSEPVYLIMTAGHYSMLQRNTEIQSRVLFTLDGFHDEPGDELVVVTQSR